MPLTHGATHKLPLSAQPRPGEPLFRFTNRTSPCAFPSLRRAIQGQRRPPSPPLQRAGRSDAGTAAGSSHNMRKPHQKMWVCTCAMGMAPIVSTLLLGLRELGA